MSMEKRAGSQTPSPAKEELSNEIQELILTLPKVKLWEDRYFYQYQGFWYPSWFFQGIISFQRNFHAQDSDIILITFPKSGTIWLKALSFSILNRSQYPPEQNPLLTTFAHDLVPFLDLHLYTRSQTPRLEDLPKPRIFAAHVPFSQLPPSIINSNCRVVYMCRNPLDQFISEWQFMLGLQSQTSDQTYSLEGAFEMMCNGVQNFGPFWEHVLGYWKASKEQPQKILFLKYEDLKENTNFYIKKLADFLGCPFSEEEESQGIIEEISKLCSFDSMKNMEVNKSTSRHPAGFKITSFFRKGKLGDWKDYLTPSMSERLEKLVKEKLDGSGLTFKTS